MIHTKLCVSLGGHEGSEKEMESTCIEWVFQCIEIGFNFAEREKERRGDMGMGMGMGMFRCPKQT